MVSLSGTSSEYVYLNVFECLRCSDTRMSNVNFQLHDVEVVILIIVFIVQTFKDALLCELSRLIGTSQLSFIVYQSRNLDEKFQSEPCFSDVKIYLLLSGKYFCTVPMRFSSTFRTLSRCN